MENMQFLKSLNVDSFSQLKKLVTLTKRMIPILKTLIKYTNKYVL